MKTTVKLLGVAMTILVCGLTSSWAQASTGAYWVVEGNLNQKNYTLIRYYNAQNQLLREEVLKGKFLDINRRRNRTYLDRRLAYVDSQPELSVRNGRKAKSASKRKAF
jgi:hypothetical protein